MPRYAPSINETVEQVLNGVDSSVTPKLAAKTASKKAPELSPLKKLAGALRDVKGPTLNYDVLHVVKTAMLNGDFGALPKPELLPEHGDKVSAGLRKLANALREDDHTDHERLLAKGAHVLKASRGLMLLRELVRE